MPPVHPAEACAVIPLRADSLFFVPAAVIFFWNIYRMVNPEALQRYAMSVSVHDLVLYREPDAVYHLYSFSILAGFIAGLTVLYRGWRKSVDSSHRRQLAIILFAVVSSFTFIFLFANIFTMHKIKVVMIYVLIPFAASLLVITVTVLGERAWTVEKLLEIIKRMNSF
jgi:fructose-specific phosphotransferase system IIC component